MSRDTNNSADDEFGSFISEEEYNKRHRKALKDADPSYKKKKTKKKTKKKLYEN